MEKYKDLLSILALPYLFIVSAMYYTGYWNQFNINILSHLKLIDTILGIFLPLLIHLIPALFYIGTFLIIKGIAFLLDTYFKLENKLMKFRIILGLTLVIMAINAMLISKTNLRQFILYDNWAGYISLILFTIIYSLVLDLFYVLSINNNRNTNTILIIIILFLLPLYTLMAGISNGLNVKNLVSYNRVETNLLKTNKGVENYPYLIFLGKGGDAYFFVTPDFKHNLIADKSTFNNLIYTTYKKNEFKEIMDIPKVKALLQKPLP